MKGTIIYNKDKGEAKALKEKYLAYFKKKNIKIVSSSLISEANFLVVIGGDGTLLRASKKILSNQDIDVFAVNAGSLGFLTEIKKDEFEKTFDAYLNGDYEVERRAFLKLKYKDEEIEVLNEIVVSKANAISKILNLNVFLDDKFLCRYKADGLIIATPTGSTAYSLSAGGPIVMPGLKCSVITPLAPHNLTTRPIVVESGKGIAITLDSNQKAYVIVDGEIKKEFLSKDKIEIVESERKLKLILPIGRNYSGILRDKLKWGDNLC